MPTRWQTYLDGLPNGVHSYPECQEKAAIARTLIDGFGHPLLPDEVPQEVRQLAFDPPPGGVFIPVVHARAMVLAMGDALGLTDEQMIDRSKAATAKMMHSPIYRVMMIFISPDKMAKASPSRWGSFHKNFDLVIDLNVKGRCQGHVKAPPGADSILLSRLNSCQFEIALAAVGGKNIKTITREIKRDGETYIQSDTTWTT